LAKFGMKGSTLFLPLYNTKPGETSPHLHFAKAKKIAKVAPAFLKMVEGDDKTRLPLFLLARPLASMLRIRSSGENQHSTEVLPFWG
jgi:hypothetical protein